MLYLIAFLLLLMLASMERRRFEEYFEKNRLPNGEQVSLHKYVLIAFPTAIAVLAITGEILWCIFLLFGIIWLGPHIEYAVKWNFFSNKTS